MASPISINLDCAFSRDTQYQAANLALGLPYLIESILFTIIVALRTRLLFFC